MPRPRSPHPKMVRDRQRNEAVCRYYDPGTGRRRFARLGPWGSEEAERNHARLLASLRAAATPPPARSDLTVAEVCVRFARHARDYYRHPDGTPTSEFGHFRLLLKSLADAAGPTVLAEFGPVAFKQVRESFVARGWSRPYVNQQCRRVRQVVRWAAEAELCPAAVWQALGAVTGLRAGRTRAPEPAKVTPAPLRAVAATIRRLSPTVAAMVRLQWLTGCRPQDVCHLRVEDIDRTGAVWVYRPATHKGRWRGKTREVYLGPRCQALLAPLLPAAGHVFSPARAVAGRHAARSESRATPRYPSHMKRNAAKRTRSPGRPPKEKYTTGSYGRAVLRACRAAGVTPWTPLQLRHSAGTRFRRLFGLEAAQVLLGHERADVTQIYAERPRELAINAAARAA